MVREREGEIVVGERESAAGAEGSATVKVDYDEEVTERRQVFGDVKSAGDAGGNFDIFVLDPCLWVSGGRDRCVITEKLGVVYGIIIACG